MKILQDRFTELTPEVKAAAVIAVEEEKHTLGVETLRILGYNPEEAYTSEEILEKLATLKTSSVLTLQQEQAIVDLTVRTQIQLIRKIVDLLKLRAVDLGLDVKDLSVITSFEPDDEIPVIKYPGPETTASPGVTISPDTAADDVAELSKTIDDVQKALVETVSETANATD